MNPAVWLRAARAPFFLATVVPVLLGSAAGWYDAGRLSWVRLTAAALGALLIHAGANLMNEYVDHLIGADRPGPRPTRYSGGSGVIQDGLVTPASVAIAAAIAFLAGALAGLYLNHVTEGNVVLLLGAAGVLLAYSYSGRPFMLGYRGLGLGELSVGVSFGPLLVLGSYYVQAEQLSRRALLLSLPSAILIALVLLINGIPDRETDAPVGKRTLAVVLGEARALSVYRSLMWTALAVVVVLVASRSIPPACLIALGAAPLVVRGVAVSSRGRYGPEELAPASAATVALHAAVGLLLALGLVVDRVAS